MKLPGKILLILILCLASIFASAQENELKIPDEIAPFVEKDMKAIALETADLNGDGRKDFILVLDTTKKDSEDETAGESDRPMLILTRGADGKLTLAARNDAVVYCRDCGGVYGDPFDGAALIPNGFTVRNIGGSSDRWNEFYEFKYSRPDKTWQLVRAVSKYYNVFKPKQMKTEIRTPKDFGKVSFSDFSLDIFQAKKAK